VLADRVQDRAGTRNALCWRLVSEKNAKMSLIIFGQWRGRQQGGYRQSWLKRGLTGEGREFCSRFRVYVTGVMECYLECYKGVMSNGVAKLLSPPPPLALGRLH
jgi:hypothetical protein